MRIIWFKIIPTIHVALLHFRPLLVYFISQCVSCEWLNSTMCGKENDIIFVPKFHRIHHSDTSQKSIRFHRFHRILCHSYKIFDICFGSSGLDFLHVLQSNNVWIRILVLELDVESLLTQVVWNSIYILTHQIWHIYQRHCYNHHLASYTWDLCYNYCGQCCIIDFLPLFWHGNLSMYILQHILFYYNHQSYMYP